MMLSLKGVYLLAALANGGEAGLKQMASMDECLATARSYAAQPRFTAVQCLQDPVIGSAAGLAASRSQDVSPREVFDFMTGLMRQVVPNNVFPSRGW